MREKRMLKARRSDTEVGVAQALVEPICDSSLAFFHLDVFAVLLVGKFSGWVVWGIGGTEGVLKDNGVFRIIYVIYV